MKLVVGLGNPGLKYTGTRHNFGFMVIDELVRRYAANLTAGSFSALSGTIRLGCDKVIVLQPQTYMNSSGRSVAPAASYYRIEPEDILVVYDELALPLGQIRIRAKGSAGGHNGMKSIISSLGTEEFPRLRLGIDRPEDASRIVDYVLANFTKKEIATVEQVVSAAADAVETWVTQGTVQAMSKYNGSVIDNG